jgi:hypothetical protein
MITDEQRQELMKRLESLERSMEVLRYTVPNGALYETLEKEYQQTLDTLYGGT